MLEHVPASALPALPPANPDDLLAWYDRHHRRLPWRANPGELADPYRVWLSEVMLQQTTVVTVGPYYQRFLELWPTVEALAAAELDAVLTQWAGLGYYARARNLHKCAKAVAELHGGIFPGTEAGLLTLPGIGAYTAAAVAAIAFGERAVVVDGNVERVIARLFALEEPMPDAKPTIKALAGTLTPDRRAGDFAQAMMDLGATICTPRKPKCLHCPWNASCAGRIAGIAEELPRKRPKAQKPTRKGVAFWLVNPRGEVLLRRRPESGLLGGMMEVPSTDWLPSEPDLKAARGKGPAPVLWRQLPGLVRHTFTHFNLELTVLAGQTSRIAQGQWVPFEKLGEVALPTVMMKIARHALRHAGTKPDEDT
jgi:A/G-specific adenine glycosylase